MRSGKEVRFAGKPASPGYARGPVHFVSVVDFGHPPKTPPASRAAPVRLPADAQDEVARLRDAAATAAAELRALIARLEQDPVRDREAIGILAFQVAFLEDAAMLAPVLEAVAAGESAASAWLAAMGRQIDIYRGADDEYFRARASDLRDICNRVLACLDRSFATEDRFAELPAGALLVTDDL
jgi:phosphoenolpyruvate-protein phosphotransferase (PTS system enzyme I)